MFIQFLPHLDLRSRTVQADFYFSYRNEEFLPVDPSWVEKKWVEKSVMVESMGPSN